jgi:glutamyl/glutaminyl-tRNA synthetase
MSATVQKKKSTSSAVVQTTVAKRFACAHRDRPIDESLIEFRAVRDGKYKAGEVVLRMKQSLTDPAEDNLAANRVLENSHHPQTGDKWKIYPTYDFTRVTPSRTSTTHSTQRNSTSLELATISCSKFSI